ncbi:MAG: LysR family transcriptional regulator [Schaedlerella sp.]|nr:LysR family transcriptional regulator [Lachnospiraceae bacterium]MDY4201449.1 LysR family transcriptional regulator [Schaedlerella sp.]
MEMTQIRYFLEVAESQHMTASAEKLHIAQPALSQSIRRLEKNIGVPLFESKGRNIVLTEYGKYLQSQLIPIMDQLDKLPEILRAMAKLNGETIHLNVLAASTLVTNAIIEYKTKHKGLNFQLLQNMQSEVFDIEITTKMFYQSNPGRIKNQFVCEEKIYLAVPDNEKYHNRKSISLKEVENEGFISLMGSRQFRYICDKFCHHAGILPHIIFESDNPAAVKNMIAANLGIGFWPEFTWGKLENDKVLLLEIDDPECSRDILITYNKNKTDDSNVRDFFEFLKGFCEKQRTACQAGD